MTAGGRARCPQRAAVSPRSHPGALSYYMRKSAQSAKIFGDATGARTFLSAAAPEYSTGLKRSRALLPFDVAADKNVRAPLWFRLRRPGDSAPYLRSLIGCHGEGEIYGPKGFWLKTLNCG